MAKCAADPLIHCLLDLAHGAVESLALSGKRQCDEAPVLGVFTTCHQVTTDEGVDETTWTARFADEQCTKLAERQGAIVGKAPHNLRLRGGKPVRRQQGGQCPVALALRREDQEPQFFFCSHTAPLNSAGASTTCRRANRVAPSGSWAGR